MNIIERVARAICRASNGGDPVSEDSDLTGLKPGDAGFCPEWVFYRGDAIAAIKEMREPTDKMIEAGSGALWASDDSPNDAVACWQAMIDAALEETK